MSWGGMGGGGGGSGGFFQFGGGGVATMGGGAAAKGAQPADGLYDLLQAVVSPESWEALGGEGVVVRFRDQLIVRQTAANHQKIASVLADLRQFASASESVPDEAGKPEQTKLKSTYYRIQGDSPETIRHLLLSLEDSAQENVAGSTPTTDSATGKIVATRDGLVIRQTAAGHQRIQRWLKRMVLLDQVIELDGEENE